MKKFLFVMIAVIFALMLPVSAFAEDVITEDSAETPIEENITEEPLPDLPTEESPEDIVTPPVEDTKEDFLEQIDNETLDKIIALGQELKDLKESDYTFEERMLQLINSENLSSTIGTIATVVTSIAIFVFRNIQKKNFLDNSGKIKIIDDDVLDLKETVDALKTENTELKEKIDKLIEVIEINSVKLEQINIDTTENKIISDTAKTATIATAKMVSDAFGHSRTIDAATKALITYDYLEVLKASEGETKTEEV